MFYTQENRLISIDIPQEQSTILLTGFKGAEGISQLYSYNLDLIAYNKSLDFKNIVGHPATITIELNSGKRHINGIITSMIQEEGGYNEKTGDNFASYKAILSPSLWMLDRTSDCMIFQNLAVPDIVSDVLRDNGITYKMDLKAQYPKWEYCTQYNETDLNFINRLMEEEGIYYYFEHTQKSHTMIITDRNDCHKTCPNQESVRYKESTVSTWEEESITSMDSKREIIYGRYTINDRNFLIPKNSLRASTPTLEEYGPGKREAYYYSAGHDTRDEGRRVSKIRMEEEEAQSFILSGESECRAFSSGYKFLLTDHYRDDMNNKEYLLTTIDHEADEPYGQDSEFTYSNTFTCIPVKTQFRPKQRAAKPIMPGSQTATVVGPKGEEIYTDQYGRIKVQFHWDRLGNNDEHSSCWMRVSQPSAGTRWGFISIPRVGHEVVVDFIEGDPDRPIVTGSVYHDHNRSAYELPAHKTRSTFKSNSTIGSNGFNELRFEDKKDEEEIFIHGQKDWNIVIENDKGQKVGRDETLHVGNNRTKTVDVDQSEKIGKNKTITVGENHDETIGKNKTLTVQGNHVESIKGNTDISMGGELTQTVTRGMTEKIGDNFNVNIGKNASELVGDSKKIDVGRDFTTRATDQILTVSNKQIRLESGSATVIIKSSGEVIINGASITVNASGEITMKGSKVYAN